MTAASDPSAPPIRRGTRIGPLLLGAAGALILIAVVWRERQLAQWRRDAPVPSAVPRALAPRFSLADHRRHVVKFERFLGRQRVLLLFVDAKTESQHDPRLRRLVECFAAIDGLGVEIVAVGTATPYANLEAERGLGRPFPFPVLTDIDIHSPVDVPVHRLWGRYDERRNAPLPGLFLIGRDGTVSVGPDGLPIPVADEQGTLDRLCRGEWPD